LTLETNVAKTKGNEQKIDKNGGKLKLLQKTIKTLSIVILLG